MVPLRRISICVLALLAISPLIACGDDNSPGGGDSTPPSATGAAISETPQPTSASTPEPTPPESEQGEAPIFWRTEGGFASLRAGTPYKVLFRVTSGYEGDAITVTAMCTSCAVASERQELSFDASRAEPVGSDAPGAYYPFNLELPFAGTWEVTVVAGDDQAMLTVEAQPAGGGGATG